MMAERLVTLLHVFGWIGGIIFPIIWVLVAWAAIAYIDSTRELLDKLKGQKRTFKAGPFFWMAVLCWSVVYITW